MIAQWPNHCGEWTFKVDSYRLQRRDVEPKAAEREISTGQGGVVGDGSLTLTACKNVIHFQRLGPVHHSTVEVERPGFSCRGCVRIIESRQLISWYTHFCLASARVGEPGTHQHMCQNSCETVSSFNERRHLPYFAFSFSYLAFALSALAWYGFLSASLIPRHSSPICLPIAPKAMSGVALTISGRRAMACQPHHTDHYAARSARGRRNSSVHDRPAGRCRRCYHGRRTYSM
jgi:hypothetical protein